MFTRRAVGEVATPVTVPEPSTVKVALPWPLADWPAAVMITWSVVPDAVALNVTEPTSIHTKLKEADAGAGCWLGCGCDGVGSSPHSGSGSVS